MQSPVQKPVEAIATFANCDEFAVLDDCDCIVGEKLLGSMVLLRILKLVYVLVCVICSGAFSRSLFRCLLAFEQWKRSELRLENSN